MAEEQEFPVPRRARAAMLCNYDRLIGALTHRGLDGVVVHLRPNVFYLSGLAPPSAQSINEGSGYAAIVISRHEPDRPIAVVADYALAFFADQPTWIDDIRPYSLGILPAHLAPSEETLGLFVPPEVLGSAWGRRASAHYRGGFAATLRQAMTELGLSRGAIGLDAMNIREAVDLDGVDVVDAYGLMRYVRQVKTAPEVELLRTAASLNQHAIEQTVGSWRPGSTWRELTHEYNMIVAAADGFVHDPGGIIVANPTSGAAVYHAASGLEDFEIKPGSNIMIDAHGTWNQYCWDGGKTWFVDDQPTSEGSRIAKACSEALHVMQSQMRPGMNVSDLVALGRRVIERSGAPGSTSAMLFFHGVGLDHIDLETTIEGGDWQVEEGMVLATHVVFPGSVTERHYLEGIAVVRADGGESLYSWDYEPLTNG